MRLRSLTFSHGGLAYAQLVWNEQLDEFQQITNLHFDMSGAVITGVIGKIRTRLVDVVSDLTADTPLAELPRKDQVDAVVGRHIGAQFNTTIHAANGPAAIGTNAQATGESASIEESIRLLDAVRISSANLDDLPSKVELLEAVD